MIKGGKGSGKTTLLYDVLEKFSIPCFVLHVYELTNIGGSDAFKVMENVFNRSKKMAPSVLLIDPLQAIAADNQQKRMDRSSVDDALLVQLFHILKEAKESGVTVVGMMNDDMTILPSVTLGFDETVCFSTINHS